MKKQIKWQKWIDPIATSKAAINEEFSITNELIGKQLMSTPLGFIGDIQQSLVANNYYDFWVLHTNFDITKETANCIKVVAGVETLDIFSRYTARVGISRSGFFDSEEVKIKVSENIRTQEQSKKYMELNGLPEIVAKEAIDIINDMYDKYNNWMIFILPNGRLECIHSNIEDDEYASNTTNLRILQNSIGGRLVSS